LIFVELNIERMLIVL